MGSDYNIFRITNFAPTGKKGLTTKAIIIIIIIKSDIIL